MPRTLFVCLFSAALLGAQPTPADHPPTDAPDNRAQAAKLTVALAPESVEAIAVIRRNFIDDHIFSKMERDGVPHAPLANDATFFRRVHLDMTGRPPDERRGAAVRRGSGPGQARQAHRTARRLQRVAGAVDALLPRPMAGEPEPHRLGGPQRLPRLRARRAAAQPAVRRVRPGDDHRLGGAATTTSGRRAILVRWAQFGDNCTEIMHEDTADEMTVMLFKHFMGVNLQCISCHDGANHLEKMNVWLTARKTARAVGASGVLRPHACDAPHRGAQHPGRVPDRRQDS